MKQKPNLNRAGNMDVDAWWERQVFLRTDRRILERNRAFIREHAGDADAELLVLLRREAEALGRMPQILELPGGLYLRRRLGDWDALAERLGYAPADTHLSMKAAYHRLKAQEEERFRAERKALKQEKLRQKELRGNVPDKQPNLSG